MNLRNKVEIFANDYNGVKYQYENGPVSKAAPNWFVEGLNCQLLIHLAYQQFFEITLPQVLRSSEMYADQEWFVEKDLSLITSINGIREGDLVFMGPKSLNPQRSSNDEDAKLLHLAMVANISSEGIELIHARPYQGIIIEPMEKVMNLRRGSKRPYEKVFAVRGLRTDVRDLSSWLR